MRAISIDGKIEAGSPIRRILDWTHAYDLIIGWKTGIGNWSDTALRRAMREGVTTVMRTVTTKTLSDRWNIKTGEVETRYARRLFKDSEVLQYSVLAVANNNEYHGQLVANDSDHRPLDDTDGRGSSPTQAASLAYSI